MGGYQFVFFCFVLFFFGGGGNFAGGVSTPLHAMEKLNHVLKTDGVKLFKDLLTNKIFLSRFYLGILRWSFI